MPTLAQIAANNTSGSDDYKWDSSNPTIQSYFDASSAWDKSLNLSPSKVSDKNLTDLVGGVTNNVFFLWVPWWGHGSHINIGYSDQVSAQTDKEAAEMGRSGTGCIINYYGPTYNSSQYKMRDSCHAIGLRHFVMVDSNSPEMLSAGDKTAQLLSFFTSDIIPNFMNKSTYLRIGGRPVVMDFGMEAYGSINWTTIRTQLAAHGINPIWLTRNNPSGHGGFADGQYFWISTSDSVATQLANFYAAKAANPSKFHWGGVFKGFHDKLTCPASLTLGNWCSGAVRDVPQNDGQTYRDTIDAARSNGALQGIIVVTANDYEEGTGMFFGIGAGATYGCTVSLSGNVLSWAGTGNQNCVAAWRIWASTDLTNYTLYGEYPKGTNSVDLVNVLPVGGAAYRIKVESVGIALVVNKLSSNYVSAISVSGSPGTGGGVVSTPNLGISHIASSQNQKEVTANTAFDKLDGALSGESIIAMADANQTLSASQALEAMMIACTGALTANRNVIVPTNKKVYMISNQTTGGHSVVVKTAAGTGITVATTAIVYCDGTNVISIYTA